MRQTLLIPPTDRHASAFIEQFLRQSESQTVRAPGNKKDAIIEL
jgi:hypothetical protein